jgi:metal-dependent amidase/aminoacylase/carboxypeptidase family protein
MKRWMLALACLGALPAAMAADPELRQAVARQYKEHLGALFDHFHRTPDLSFMEVKSAARMAQELRAAGCQVTENVGGTGVVAILKNGPGPMAMLRADMDGLPVEEKSGLPNASRVLQKDREGNQFLVAHACGQTSTSQAWSAARLP